jgi:hypothetical protein
MAAKAKAKVDPARAEEIEAQIMEFAADADAKQVVVLVSGNDSTFANAFASRQGLRVSSLSKSDDVVLKKQKGLLLSKMELQLPKQTPGDKKALVVDVVKQTLEMKKTSVVAATEKAPKPSTTIDPARLALLKAEVQAFMSDAGAETMISSAVTGAERQHINEFAMKRGLMMHSETLPGSKDKRLVITRKGGPAATPPKVKPAKQANPPPTSSTSAKPTEKSKTRAIDQFIRKSLLEKKKARIFLASASVADADYAKTAAKGIHTLDRHARIIVKYHNGGLFISFTFEDPATTTGSKKTGTKTTTKAKVPVKAAVPALDKPPVDMVVALPGQPAITSMLLW